MLTNRIICGEALQVLRGLPARILNTVVTSPPYYGLRDYGVADQLGAERTPPEYVARLVAILREARRVLRDDGTLWLNLGDVYASGRQGRCDVGRVSWHKPIGKKDQGPQRYRGVPPGLKLKKKDLIGIPWMVAFALRADGWYLRGEIIWAKKNCMPESVSDRPTRAHETIFLLSKSPRYYYDADAIAEPQEERERRRRLLQAKRGLASVYVLKRDSAHGMHAPSARGCARSVQARAALAERGTRNKRSVWHVSTSPFPDAHFATFPPALIEPCILAGSPRGGGSPRPVHGRGYHGRRGAAQRPALPRCGTQTRLHPHRQPEASA